MRATCLKNKEFKIKPGKFLSKSVQWFVLISLLCECPSDMLWLYYLEWMEFNSIGYGYLVKPSMCIADLGIDTPGAFMAVQLEYDVHFDRGTLLRRPFYMTLSANDRLSWKYAPGDNRCRESRIWHHLILWLRLSLQFSTRGFGEIQLTENWYSRVIHKSGISLVRY